MMREALGCSVFSSFIAVSFTRSEVERAQEVKNTQHTHAHTGEVSPLALSVHPYPLFLIVKYFLNFQPRS